MALELITIFRCRTNQNQDRFSAVSLPLALLRVFDITNAERTSDSQKRWLKEPVDSTPQSVLQSIEATRSFPLERGSVPKLTVAIRSLGCIYPQILSFRCYTGFTTALVSVLWRRFESADGRGVAILLVHSLRYRKTASWSSVPLPHVPQARTNRRSLLQLKFLHMTFDLALSRASKHNDPFGDEFFNCEQCTESTPIK